MRHGMRALVGPYGYLSARALDCEVSMCFWVFFFLGAQHGGPFRPMLLVFIRRFARSGVCYGSASYICISRDAKHVRVRYRGAPLVSYCLAPRLYAENTLSTPIFFLDAEKACQ